MKMVSVTFYLHWNWFDKLYAHLQEVHIFLSFCYPSMFFVKFKNACTSLKFVTMPTETRTAPLDFPSMHRRKSSIDRRCSCSGCEQHTASSMREMTRASSPAPGLQKHPVRNDILDLLASSSMARWSMAWPCVLKKFILSPPPGFSI